MLIPTLLLVTLGNALAVAAHIFGSDTSRSVPHSTPHDTPRFTLPITGHLNLTHARTSGVNMVQRAQSRAAAFRRANITVNPSTIPVNDATVSFVAEVSCPIVRLKWLY